MLNSLSLYAVRGWTVCWIAILVAGLYPFTPTRRNRAEWSTQDGVRFTPNSLAIASVPTADILQGHHPAAGFTLEMLLRPRSEELRLQSILAQDDVNSAPRFAVEQWGKLLLLRAYCASSPVVYKKVGVEALAAGQVLHVAITSGKDGTILFVQGNRAESIECRMATQILSGKLLLGNNGFLTEPWSGDLLLLGVYDRPRTADEIASDSLAWHRRRPELDELVALFDFREGHTQTVFDRHGTHAAITSPAHIRVLHPRYLRWDLKPNLSGLSDVAINFAGFVPFGVLGIMVMRRGRSLATAALLVVLFGSIASLAIEMLQAFIPLRSSSSTDWLMNTIGTALGACLIGLSPMAVKLDGVLKREMPARH